MSNLSARDLRSHSPVMQPSRMMRLRRNGKREKSQSTMAVQKQRYSKHPLSRIGSEDYLADLYHMYLDGLLTRENIGSGQLQLP